MLTPLSQAPIGPALRIHHILGGDFSNRVAKLGLHEGSTLTRLEESARITSAKVRGGIGDVVLSGWLAGQIVMHLDNDSRLPLLECPPGSSGHVEGITGHIMAENALRELGIAEGDTIVFLRQVPPMIYNIRVNGKHEAKISEGMAAKLLGKSADGFGQFCSVGVGDTFTVDRILGGENTLKTLAAMQIAPEAHLVLLSVSASQSVSLTKETGIVCMTQDGLRLYFREKDADAILVGAD